MAERYDHSKDCEGGEICQLILQKSNLAKNNSHDKSPYFQGILALSGIIFDNLAGLILTS
jgi:hypothetical protein